MNKEKFNQIIDEVYENYQKTHQDELFIMSDEMGLTKDEFIKKATNNYGFGYLYGIQLNEWELTFEEQIQWVMKHTDVELENLYITEEVYKPTTPTKVLRLVYKDEEIEVYN